MKIAIYSRKSIYTGKGESIENQIEMCRQYIALNIPNAKEEDIVVYEDEGFSGKNMERPQFKKMMADSHKDKFDYLVCYRLDRVSRSISDFAPFIEDLIDRNISFVCIKEKFDTSTSIGKAMMYIASIFAQLERETIAERVRDNMSMLARMGRWLGGIPPTGFTSEKVEEIIIDGKIKTSCKLVFNQDEISIVKLMFDKFMELHSVAGVSKYLIRNNIKSRIGKFYSSLGIKEILQNPVYCIADADALRYFTAQNADICFNETTCSDKLGLLSYNKRDYKKKSAPRQSMDKWIIAIGNHKGIICGKKWVAIQNMLDANKHSNHEISTHNGYSLLSGLVYCSKCSNKMFSKPRSNNPDLFDYMCSIKIRGGATTCDCQNLGGRQADDMVCLYLMEFTEEDSGIYQLLENLKKDLRTKTIDNPIEAIEKQKKDCQTEMDNLIKTLSKTNYSEAFIDGVNHRMAELAQTRAQLDEKLKQAQTGIQIVDGRTLEIDVMTASLSSLKDNFHDLTIQQKRTLIKLLVQKIIWDGKDLHIFIYGE